MGKVVYLYNNIKKVKKMKTKVSKGYTVKAFVKNVDRLKGLGLVSAENSVKLEEIRKDIVENYIQEEIEKLEGLKVRNNEY